MAERRSPKVIMKNCSAASRTGKPDQKPATRLAHIIAKLREITARSQAEQTKGEQKHKEMVGGRRSCMIGLSGLLLAWRRRDHWCHLSGSRFDGRLY